MTVKLPKTLDFACVLLIVYLFGCTGRINFYWSDELSIYYYYFPYTSPSCCTCVTMDVFKFLMCSTDSKTKTILPLWSFRDTIYQVLFTASV